MIPNQKILLILLSTFLMVGCAKNEISIYNLGSKEWHNINVSAGGRSFKVEKLNEGASHTLRFNSKSEGGGEINAELDGTVHKREFGYFTPNLTDNYEIMLKDDGSIWINEGVDN